MIPIFAEKMLTLQITIAKKTNNFHMGFFSKILAGGIGWALGGPIGAIIGVAIASAFDGKISDYSRRIESDATAQNERQHGKQQTTTGDFMMAFLVLQAAVMRADGMVRKSELNVVKAQLRQVFGDETALEALKLLQQILQQDIPVEQVSFQVRVRMTAPARRELLHMLFCIAYADGVCDRTESALLDKIAIQMGISRADVDSIKAMFSTRQDPEWAYKVLEITADATDDEVKKAYRKMAMKYHPDKVSSLGEEIAQTAAEKFRKIHEAYNEIKKQRNIK